MSGTRIEDRVTTKDEGPLDLERIRHLVPLLEAWVVVVSSVTFVSMEYGNDQVLDGTLDPVGRDVVRTSHDGHDHQTTLVKIDMSRKLVLSKSSLELFRPLPRNVQDDSRGVHRFLL
jgi:hypothetical protein